MSRRGDVYTNPVTGERVVVRHGTEDGPGTPAVDLYVQPGGAVVGAHVHPDITERFTVVAGRVGLMIDGRSDEGGPGTTATAAPGVPHDWWNAGDEEAHVIVELEGPSSERFEQMIIVLFGLAHEGKVNAKGLPGPLQLAVIAQEYDDVIRFLKPPRLVQKALFGPLAALGRARGLRPSYPHHRELVVTRD
ncbi:MAG TPA: cupin domain-containing protein [Solirubrobacteraceae bacterium]